MLTEAVLLLISASSQRLHYPLESSEILSFDIANLSYYQQKLLTKVYFFESH